MTTDFGANPLEYISDIEELMAVHDFLKDDRLAACMNLTIKLLTKDEINAQRVAKVVKDLGAYSAYFRMQYVYYMGLGKTTKDAAVKKNIYRSAYEGTDRLGDSLKYLIKV